MKSGGVLLLRDEFRNISSETLIKTFPLLLHQSLKEAAYGRERWQGPCAHPTQYTYTHFYTLVAWRMGGFVKVTGFWHKQSPYKEGLMLVSNLLQDCTNEKK